MLPLPLKSVPFLIRTNVSGHESFCCGWDKIRLVNLQIWWVRPLVPIRKVTHFLVARVFRGWWLAVAHFRQKQQDEGYVGICLLLDRSPTSGMSCNSLGYSRATCIFLNLYQRPSSARRLGAIRWEVWWYGEVDDDDILAVFLPKIDDVWLLSARLIID